ncbi:MAG: S8 family peptidase, partial [Gammaproteobacteria bacterium]|nr:S8 family peptidase [Gammaproteobacteria bacterium]
ETSYIEPELRSIETETVSVIVTAKDDWEAAARAVERVGGQVTSELWIIEAVAADISADHIDQLAADPVIRSVVRNKGVKSSQEPLWDGWVADYPIPVPYDGSPDTQPTNDDGIWNLANPVSIDIGADIVHNTGVDGQGVGIAVLDSGVFFETKIKNKFNDHLNQNFFGQIDFVGNGSCPSGGSRDQYTDYCFSNKDNSYDGYGHGSHIAGIIWNNIQDQDTGVKLGIAPGAGILSVRVLGSDGTGTYADVIEGIQYVVVNKDTHNIRVMNMSLSAYPTTPYFEDPLNRAVEVAWANEIVVVVVAGNSGPGSESITVPGNDPYVITVGAVGNPRTPGYWGDDYLPTWSATGPTWDGFAKPDVLAPATYITSFMYRDENDINLSDELVKQHPDNSISSTMFRMSGTSQATAVTSGVVALMLDENTSLTPDQIKYRLTVSARPALTSEDPPSLTYNILQQGLGRIWAPDAVLGDFPADAQANDGMDIQADLAHGTGWVDANGDGMVDSDEVDPSEMAYHYAGQIGRMTSDDGQAHLYYLLNSSTSSSPPPNPGTLTATQDTYINKEYPTQNYGQCDQLFVDEGGGDPGDGRTLMQFDLSAISAGTTVTSAQLVLT